MIAAGVWKESESKLDEEKYRVPPSPLEVQGESKLQALRGGEQQGGQDRNKSVLKECPWSRASVQSPFKLMDSLWIVFWKVCQSVATENSH